MNILRFKSAAQIISLLIAFIPLNELSAAQVLFTPTLTLSEEYSDNIFLSYRNEVDDYITTPSLNLDLQVTGRTAGMQLVLNPSYNAFADNSDYDYWRYAGRLGFWDQVGRNTRLELTSDYLETENPTDQSANYTPDNPLAGPAIGTDLTRRGRNRYRTEVSVGRFTHQFGPRDNLSVAMQYSHLEDVDPLPGQALEDNTNWQPSLGVAYWFTQRWGVSLDGYYSNRDYVDPSRNNRDEYTGTLRLQYAYSQTLTGFLEYRHTALYFEQPIDDDYQISEPAIGLTYQFQRDASITISGGYYTQDFKHLDTKEGWIVNSSIYKRWTFRSSYLNLTGASGYQVQDAGAQDLGLDIYYEGRLEAGYNFTPRFTAMLFGGYRQDKYTNITPERTDKTTSSGASLSYQAFQWLSASLSYNYNDVNSDVAAQEYTENRVTLILTMQPSHAMRLN